MKESKKVKYSSSPKVVAPATLLPNLGRAVRKKRTEAALSLRALAEKSGLSERFLIDVEGGKANVSVLRLAEIAAALGSRTGELLDAAEKSATEKLPPTIALVGLRGAGKTTLGKRLAQKLGVTFVELDERIVEEAGMSLSTLFEVHGEARFRELERLTLERVLTRESPCVVATSGSIVTDERSYSLLRERAITVWLRASPEDHFSRVEAQGDRRPMQGRPRAMAELRDILRSRETLYARAAHKVDTSALTLAKATERLVALTRSAEAR